MAGEIWTEIQIKEEASLAKRQLVNFTCKAPWRYVKRIRIFPTALR